MAAIIAQLAAANRKRKARRKATLPPDKSNRTLPPFDPCFDPNKHNPYLRLKALVDHRNEINRTARGNSSWKSENAICLYYCFNSFFLDFSFVIFRDLWSIAKGWRRMVLLYALRKTSTEPCHSGLIQAHYSGGQCDTWTAKKKAKVVAMVKRYIKLCLSSAFSNHIAHTFYHLF